jgi:hypothetical protein
MPDIHISDDLFERLGRWARPFESPSEVIQRLLDEKEDVQPPREVDSSRPRESRSNSIRGAVSGKWGQGGRPNWDINATIRACEEQDEMFRQTGKNPAPRFREALDKVDQTYIRTWVYGCHFPWLNPR